MITEDYVNKQIALLLREKGFDEPTLYHYNGDNKEPTHTINYDLLKNSELKEFCSAAPTIQMVLKWLREVHEKYIEVCTDIDYDFKNIIFRSAVCDKSLGTLKEFDNCPTYEAACETAIKYILESLI